jgi:hypothetical protein
MDWEQNHLLLRRSLDVPRRDKRGPSQHDKQSRHRPTEQFSLVCWITLQQIKRDPPADAYRDQQDDNDTENHQRHEKLPATATRRLL